MAGAGWTWPGGQHACPRPVSAGCRAGELYLHTYMTDHAALTEQTALSITHGTEQTEWHQNRRLCVIGDVAVVLQRAGESAAIVSPRRLVQAVPGALLSRSERHLSPPALSCRPLRNRPDGYPTDVSRQTAAQHRWTAADSRPTTAQHRWTAADSWPTAAQQHWWTAADSRPTAAQHRWTAADS